MMKLSAFATAIARNAAQRTLAAKPPVTPRPAPKPRSSRAASAPIPDFSHLRPAAREAFQPAPTRTERGRAFAAEMERVVAQLEGRKPRALVNGPDQRCTRITGDQLAAAAKERNAERERAVQVRRSGAVGG